MFRLACVLLLLLLAYRLVAQPADDTTRNEGPSAYVDYRSKRTLFNIIWGCALTTIICAWAAIHPNIPPREGTLKGALRRLELMIWTILGPEILPCWALNQWLAAMTVRDVYNNGKGYEKESYKIWKAVKRWFSLYEIEEAVSKVWTLKHGHFLVMGGIHLVEPPEEAGTTTTEATTVADQGVTYVQPNSNSLENADTERGRASSVNKGGRVTILTLEMLEELVKDPKFEIDVTEDDVARRSKGDGLSKIILISQSTWFIFQCIGRHVQGLNLTHLELTTLALASLNGITFMLWWDKPLGAQAVVRVYLKRKLTGEERNTAGRNYSNRSLIIPFVRDLFKRHVIGIRNIIFCRTEGNIFVAWLIKLPFRFLSLLLSPTVAFTWACGAMATSLMGGGSASFPADATHVSTFYFPKHQYSDKFHALLGIALGITFGGIHCAGWYLPCPSYAEQNLWRIASLATTILPTFGFPMLGILPRLVELFRANLESSSNYKEALAGWSLAILMLAYVSARLVLLGLAVALLRHLDQTAFIAVDWTMFYPHFL